MERSEATTIAAVCIQGAWGMISSIHSMVLQGIDAAACEVEVDVARGGLGEIRLVGLPDAAVKEAVSRAPACSRLLR